MTSTHQYDSGLSAAEDATLAEQIVLAGGIEALATQMIEQADATSSAADDRTAEDVAAEILVGFDFERIARMTKIARNSLVERSGRTIWNPAKDAPDFDPEKHGWRIDNPAYVGSVLLGADWASDDRVNVVAKKDGGAVALLIHVADTNSKGFPVLDASAVRTFPTIDDAEEWISDSRRALASLVADAIAAELGDDFDLADDLDEDLF